MNPQKQQPTERTERENAPSPDSAACPPLTEAERARLADEATQEAYLKAYREQMRRMNCPGCGESEVF